MSQFEIEYRERYSRSLFPIAERLRASLEDILQDEPRIDRITTRPRSVDRFINKAGSEINGKPKYEEPLYQIQDQIGARIVTSYECDVDRVAAIVLRYFRAIESRNVVPEREWEFGYFGQHHVLLLPADVVDASISVELVPGCFELQIKTLFQHAWSEANHDLGYKPGSNPLSGIN